MAKLRKGWVTKLRKGKVAKLVGWVAKLNCKKVIEYPRSDGKTDNFFYSVREWMAKLRGRKARGMGD